MAVYGPGCHPKNIIWTEAKLRSKYYFFLWVTDWSINCHLARSAMNYLLYYKKEFGENPEENIILIAPGQYTKILTGCANNDK